MLYGCMSLCLRHRFYLGTAYLIIAVKALPWDHASSYHTLINIFLTMLRQSSPLNTVGEYVPAAETRGGKK